MRQGAPRSGTRRERARATSAVLGLALVLAATVSAHAQAPLCRITAQPWLACALPSGASLGAACACPTSGAAAQSGAGRVALAQSDELAYRVATESNKLSLGIDWLAGAVTVLIPRRIADGHALPGNATDGQLAELYDFLHDFQNLQPPSPWPTPPRPLQGAPTRTPGSP
jgi:hypothetical protein